MYEPLELHCLLLADSLPSSLSRNNYEVGTAPRMRSGPRQKAAFRWVCEVQRKQKNIQQSRRSQRELTTRAVDENASARQIKTLPLNYDSSFSAGRVPPLSALRSDLFTGGEDSFGSLVNLLKKYI